MGGRGGEGGLRDGGGRERRRQEGREEGVHICMYRYGVWVRSCLLLAHVFCLLFSLLVCCVVKHTWVAFVPCLFLFCALSIYFVVGLISSLFFVTLVCMGLVIVAFAHTFAFAFAFAFTFSFSFLSVVVCFLE